MNALLKIILSLSLSGALLILALLLVKPLVKDRLSKRWQYYIWLIVIGRLLIPLAPEANLAGTVFQYFDQVVLQVDTGQRLEQAPPMTDLAEQAGDFHAGEGKPLAAAKLPTLSIFELIKQNSTMLCLLVWFIVAVGLFIRKVTVYQSFVKYIKAGRIEISDMERWERVGKLVEQAGIKGAVGLYTNGLIASTLLMGFFRPCIMLPTVELSKSDFENTIWHELTHYKRGDMFYKWLVQITICLHWFNPLVYVMGREINRACELSCDEAVIRKWDKNRQRTYGDTLLNAMGTGGQYKDALASVTLNESAELLKERLDAIMNFKRPSKFIVLLTCVLTMVLSFAATAAGAYSGGHEIQLYHTNTQLITFEDDQELTDLDIQAVIGNVTVRYGNELKIEVGEKLVNHAFCSLEEGTLFYRDDFPKQNNSFPEWEDGEVSIVITIPQNSEIEKMLAATELGGVELQNMRVQDVEVSGINRINLNGLQSQTLTVNGQLAEIEANDIVITKQLGLYLNGCENAQVSGLIKGKVLIDSGMLTDIDMTIRGAAFDDFNIRTIWKPDQRLEDRITQSAFEKGGVSIDNIIYPYDYQNNNRQAPNTLDIVSREMLPAEHVQIRFK